MGYEITYHYYEEISKGEYNKEELKTKSVRVGSPYEDMPLEFAAGKIIAQLARRNILVVDVDIFEFTKKKLSYREADDGIVIKNKKFRFDDGAVIEVGNQVVEVSEAKTTENKEVVPQKAVIRTERFDPPPDLAKIAKSSGYKFTVGRVYPIYKELPAAAHAGIPTFNYLTIDDTNSERIINSIYFIPNTPRIDDSYSSDNGEIRNEYSERDTMDLRS